MSEQQENNQENSEVSEPAAPTTTPTVVVESKKPAAPSGRGGGGFIAWLALLLGVGLAVGVGFAVQQVQQREAKLLERVAGLETVAAGEQANLNEIGQRLKGELVQDIGALEAQLGLDVQALTTMTEAQAVTVEVQAGVLVQLEAQLAEQRTEIARFSAADREDWLLAETEYLLRLANQRLIMTRDVEAARALLRSADAVLLQLDDVGLFGARAAIAADLAVLRAVPQLDVEGIYLRLAALADQAGALVIFELPDVEAQPGEIPAEDWQGRLLQGYESALVKLSDYIIIRRRDAPMQALMDPQWEGLVRQNLRMLLEQAQAALLSGNQLLYNESLQRAEHWVGEFLESDGVAARAIARELNALKSQVVEVQLPDISRSLGAVDAAMTSRLQLTGEG
ncbi:MAG: uroporphyrin-3 C-methyltransferase [Halieaceae bacterium]